MANTYDTFAEAEADREQLLRLLDALNGWSRALRRDECGAWAIHGRRGTVHTWGDGATWGLWLDCPSDRMDTYARKRLGFCRREPGQRLRLMAIPGAQEAETIRDVLGIRKRVEYSPEVLERKRQAALAARAKRKPDGEAR